jgi:hypothetical protein
MIRSFLLCFSVLFALTTSSWANSVNSLPIFAARGDAATDLLQRYETFLEREEKLQRTISPLLQRSIEESRSRYLDGDFSGASLSARSAIKHFQSSIHQSHLAENYLLATELSLIVAMAEERLGANESDLSEILQQAHVWSPSFQPDPALISPRITKLWSHVIENGKTQNAILIVRSTPSGHRVSLNSQDVGVTPLTLNLLTPGTYSIRLGEGFSAHQQSVLVTANQKTEHHAHLGPTPDRRKAIAHNIGQGLSESALATLLATFYELDLVLFTDQKKSEDSQDNIKAYLAH